MTWILRTDCSRTQLIGSDVHLSYGRTIQNMEGSSGEFKYVLKVSILGIVIMVLGRYLIVGYLDF